MTSTTDRSADACLMSACLGPNTAASTEVPSWPHLADPSALCSRLRSHMSALHPTS
jgi:hypothetical protein